MLATAHNATVVVNTFSTVPCGFTNDNWTIYVQNEQFTFSPALDWTAPTASELTHSIVSSSCNVTSAVWSLDFTAHAGLDGTLILQPRLLTLDYILPCSVGSGTTSLALPPDPCAYLNDTLVFGKAEHAVDSVALFDINPTYYPSCVIEFGMHPATGCPARIQDIACTLNNSPGGISNSQFEWLSERTPYTPSFDCFDGTKAWFCFRGSYDDTTLVEYELEKTQTLTTNEISQSLFDATLQKDLRTFETQWMKKYTVNTGADVTRNVGGGIFVYNNTTSSNLLWKETCHRCIDTSATTCILPLYYFNYTGETTFQTRDNVPIRPDKTFVQEKQGSRYSAGQSPDYFTAPKPFKREAAAHLHCQPESTSHFVCNRVATAVDAPMLFKSSLDSLPAYDLFSSGELSSFAPTQQPTPSTYIHCLPDQCIHSRFPTVCGTPGKCALGDYPVSASPGSTCPFCAECINGTTYSLNQIIRSARVCWK